LKEIRKIINTYDQADFAKEKLALASIVKIEESSYRRIGARMLVSSNGTWIGGISGGCLEGDALRRSQKAIYNDQCSTVTYDTLDDDANEIGVGLGCNGKIEVLFNPIDPNSKENELEQLRSIANSKKPAILIKVIHDSNTNSHLGKSIVVDENLSNFAFCECTSSELTNSIKEARIKRRPQIIKHENKSGVVLELLIEYIKPETKLIVIGDNYDVISMVEIAKNLGWETHIICRSKKLPKHLYQDAEAIYEYEEAKKVLVDEYTAVVFMTHDYDWDKKLLPIFLSKKPPFLGLLGPLKRTKKMQNELGLGDLNKYDFFHSPVGLDIGAETPEEIALSISSEIIAAFRNRNGMPLKSREGTIYDRFK